MVNELTPRPRARRRDKNLQRILDAALQLVEAEGIEGLSIQKLAAAVDYTPGALYRYFDSKDAILAQLVLRILGDLRAYLDGALALLPEAAPSLTAVCALTQGYRAFAAREPQRFGLLAMTLASPRVLLPEASDADPVAVEMVAGLQALAGAIDAATRAAALAPASETDNIERTVCLFALLQGLSLLQKQARYAPDHLHIDRLAESGTRALLRGWGASNASIDAGFAALADRASLQSYFGRAC